MKRQKGQAIVEFALVLPFFFLILFGVIFSGMLFADYMTLNNAARSSAREASIDPSKSADIATAYNGYYAANSHFITGLYGTPTFRIDPDIETPPNSVKVEVTTPLNTSFPGIGIVSSLLPPNITIEYYMHKEPTAPAT